MPVTELMFDGDARGSFGVTFVPFETYRDYWGTYRFDPASGTLAMTVVSGNNIPPDLDLEGQARITSEGELAVEGFAFGAPSGASPERRDCPLRFRRD